MISLLKYATIGLAVGVTEGVVLAFVIFAAVRIARR